MLYTLGELRTFVNNSLLPDNTRIFSLTHGFYQISKAGIDIDERVGRCVVQDDEVVHIEQEIPCILFRE